MSQRSFVLGAAFVALSTSVLFFVWMFRAAPSPLPAGRQVLEPLPSGGIGDFLSRFGFAPWSPPSLVPVAVVIENHEDARPYQRGLDRALFIAEFLVEGYISRFVAFFDRDNLPEQIGPIRSLRPYFLSVIEPWASALLYAGGSPEALKLLDDSAVPWVNLLGVDDTYLRDRSVPPPHNMFLRSSFISRLFAGRRLHDVPWPPFPSGKLPYGSGASLIRLQFFSPLHNVEYRYDSLDDTYIRTTGRVTHAVRPRNVLILAMPIVSEGEHGRLDIRPQGIGSALLFSSGLVQEGRWERGGGARDPFHFLDRWGKPLRFTSGLTWMTVLPDLWRVRWESGGTLEGERGL